jgi:uncharacterized membrane protein
MALALVDLFFAVFLYGYSSSIVPPAFLLSGAFLLISASMMFRKESSVKSWGIAIVALGIAGSLLLLNPILSLPGMFTAADGVVAIRWRPLKNSDGLLRNKSG